MSVFFPVRSDLRRMLLLTPGLPPTVSWETRRFEPTVGVPYVKEKMIPAATATATLGSTGYQRETIIYQITLSFPSESAILSELEDLADNVIYQYPVGLQVGSTAAHGRVVRASRTEIMEGPEWIEINVRVTFFIHRGNVHQPV